MSNNSSPVESLLGMMFDAVVAAGILLYRLYKQHAERREEPGNDH